MERFYLNSNVTNPESGVTVQVRRLDDQSRRPNPGKTALHEAAHVVASGEIVEATIIPSGDALGTTRPKKMTVAAAAAAEAMGYSGTGWDMHYAENILGVGRSAAISAGKSALSGRGEEMYEVATVLEERKTIGQKDVEDARTNVINNRFGIHPVEVTITMPNGQASTRETQSFRGEVRIHDLLLNASNQS